MQALIIRRGTVFLSLLTFAVLGRSGGGLPARLRCGGAGVCW